MAHMKVFIRYSFSMTLVWYTACTMVRPSRDLNFLHTVHFLSHVKLLEGDLIFLYPSIQNVLYMYKAFYYRIKLYNVQI